MAELREGDGQSRASFVIDGSRQRGGNLHLPAIDAVDRLIGNNDGSTLVINAWAEADGKDSVVVSVPGKGGVLRITQTHEYDSTKRVA